MFLTQVNEFKRSSSAHFNATRSAKSGGLLSNKSSTSDLSVNRVAPLECRWLAHHWLHPSIITTGR